MSGARNETWLSFLDAVKARGPLTREDAQHAAVAALVALEGHLFDGTVRHLEAQLPSKLRALLQARSAHRAGPRRFGKEALISEVAIELGLSRADAEAQVRSVFDAVRMQVSEGEARHVLAELPAGIRGLWQRVG